MLISMYIRACAYLIKRPIVSTVCEALISLELINFFVRSILSRWMWSRGIEVSPLPLHNTLLSHILCYVHVQEDSVWFW